MVSYIVSFSLFSVLAAASPGPTNILSFYLGLNGSLRQVYLFVLAASASAAFILFVTFMGLSAFITHQPALRDMMTIVGALWLSSMSYKLFQAKDVTASRPDKLPSWRDGAFLQIINPKTWMMALTVSSIFFAPQLEQTFNAFLLAIVFFLITCPCMGSWAYVGRLTQTKTKGDGYNWINKILAVLLFMTAWGLVLSSF